MAKNRLTNKVEQLPLAARDPWFKFINGPLKNSGHSPLAATNWLVAQGFPEYQLCEGLAVAQEVGAATMLQIKNSIRNPSIMFRSDEEYYEWKRKRNPPRRTTPQEEN